MLRVLIASITVLLVVPAWAQARLPTLDEALELSRASGRPILAMAGQKT